MPQPERISENFRRTSKCRSVLIGGEHEFEIDLAAKRVDPCHSHANIVTQAKLSSVPAAFDQIFFFVVVVIVVGQRYELDQAFDEIVIQLDEKTEISQAVDEPGELFADLAHHEQ